MEVKLLHSYTIVAIITMILYCNIIKDFIKNAQAGKSHFILGPGQRKGHNAICVDQNRVQGKMDSFTVEDSDLPVQLIECLKFEAST